VVLRATAYEMAPVGAVQLRETWPLAEAAVTVGAAGGVHVPVAVTEASVELADSQVTIVLTEDTT
jgi:hypothetical protein